MSSIINGVASEYDMQKVSRTYESNSKLPQTSCRVPMPNPTDFLLHFLQSIWVLINTLALLSISKISFTAFIHSSLYMIMLVIIVWLKILMSSIHIRLLTGIERMVLSLTNSYVEEKVMIMIQVATYFDVFCRSTTSQASTFFSTNHYAIFNKLKTILICCNFFIIIKIVKWYMIVRI